MGRERKSNTDNAKTTKNGGTIPRPPRQIVINVPNPLTIRQQSDSDAAQRYREEKASRDAQVRAANRLNGITVIGVILSLLSLGGLYLTLLQTRKQFASDERPYMTVDTAFFGDLSGNNWTTPLQANHSPSRCGWMTLEKAPPGT